MGSLQVMKNFTIKESFSNWKPTSIASFFFLGPLTCLQPRYVLYQCLFQGACSPHILSCWNKKTFFKPNKFLQSLGIPFNKSWLHSENLQLWLANTANVVKAVDHPHSHAGPIGKVSLLYTCGNAVPLVRDALVTFNGITMDVWGGKHANLDVAVFLWFKRAQAAGAHSGESISREQGQGDRSHLKHWKIHGVKHAWIARLTDRHRISYKNVVRHWRVFCPSPCWFWMEGRFMEYFFADALGLVLVLSGVAGSLGCPSFLL